MFSAIIFDWDGTLVDTCDLILKAHNHVRAHYDLPLWKMEDFLGKASQSAREYYPKIYGDYADEAQRILYAYVGRHHLNFLAEKEGAKNALELIQGLGIPIGVVSNKRHDNLNKEIDHLGWRHFFKTTIGAGYAEKDKPSAIPLLLAISEIDPSIQNKDVLYVGDTETDLLTAQAAETPVAFIPSANIRVNHLKKEYNPDFFGHNLLDVLEKAIKHPF